MKNYSDLYNIHYERANTINIDSIKKISFKEIDSFLPMDKTASILDIGCGQGCLLYYLQKSGYDNLQGVDISSGQIEAAKKFLSEKVILSVNNALDFLKLSANKYDVIFLFDVIEHIKKDDLHNFLICLLNNLKANGKVIIRTPNMANLLGAYSRYLDMTHEIGFTEYSLIQLFETVGIEKYAIIDQTKFYPLRKKFFLLLRNKIYKFLFKLEGRCTPNVFDKNVYFVAEKTQPVK